MKNFRKILVSAITAAMLLCLAEPAFATQVAVVGDGDGSITVTNATEGKTYRLYKLFDATYSGDAVAYYYTKTAQDDPLYALLTSEGSPFVLTQIGDTDKYSVTSEATAAEISDWIKSNLEENDGELSDGSVLKAIKEITAAETEIKFDQLAYGYYFITSTLGTTITIDSNTPDETVIDKNQGPSWDVDEQGSGKVITSDSNKTYTPPTQENSVNVGDTVSFQIGVNTTNYNGDKEILEYYVNDELGKGFSYDKESIVVKIGDTVLTQAQGDPAVGTEYKIEWDDEANSFRITIPWYDADTETFASENANNTITVTYNATLEANDDTVYAGAGNKNKATYDFKDSSDTEPEEPGTPYHTVEEKETVTYTFALGFVKIDGKTKEPLTGAEFKLQNPDGAYIVATGENGDYTYSGTTDDEAAATVFVTDANGQLLVKGVAEGKYTVIETKAPDGYNQLASPMEITATISGSSTYTTTYTTYYDEDGNQVETQQENGTTLTRTYDVNVTELVIENNAGTLLPETGGVGTTLFYIIGSIIVVTAIVALVVERRMKKDN